MSYEYKALIEQAIIDDDRPLDWEEGFKELDEVYAQAAKADEYEAENKELLEELNYLKTVNNDLVWQRDTDEEHEAKAKAYDHIENLVKTELTSDDLYNDARNNDYVAGMLSVYEMVDYIIEEYESGGYYAKK